MDVACLEQFIHPPQRVFAPKVGAKAVALLGEFPLKDWLDHHAQRRLHHAVLYGWNPQRPLLLASRLRDVVPPDCLRPVGAGAQGFTQAGRLASRFSA